MRKDDGRVKGEVIERLPNRLFRVLLEDGEEVLCYTSGRMRFNSINVIIGDRVAIVLDPHGGKTTNRLVSRLTETPKH